jgi:hypothetical protein
MDARLDPDLYIVAWIAPLEIAAATVNWMGSNVFGALMIVVFVDNSTSPSAF